MPPAMARRNAINFNTAKLRMTMLLDKEEYLPGQTAEISLTATNPTDARLEVWVPKLSGALFVKPESAGFCECSPASATLWLEPGETIESNILAQLPDAPGEYTLIAYPPPSAPVKCRVLPPPPVLLPAANDGGTQGAVGRGHQLASAEHPARAGDALEVYATGLTYGCPAPREVTVGGQPAQILFFGRSGGGRGLDQVNIRVPTGVAPGPAVPVRLHCGNNASSEVTIGVQ